MILLDVSGDGLIHTIAVMQVVPFLPLSEAQLREILDLKLEEMSREHRYVSRYKHIHNPFLSLRPDHRSILYYHSGRLWSRLETTAELRDYLVRNPFVKYSGYAYEDKAPTTSNGNSNGKGGVCEAGGGSCKDANREGFYWFAEFGARNLHIGGPIQVR